MYFADALNQNNLYQQLGGWLPKLQAPAQNRAHSLLQRAHQAFAHLFSVDEMRRIALGQFNQQFPSLVGQPRRVHAWSPMVANLLVSLSAAFAALRVLQNESWMFAAAVYNAKNAPTSLRDAYGKMGRRGQGQKRATWVTALPPEVRNPFCDYWAQSGRQLADYRDIDQHFDVLARHCFLDLESEIFSRLWVWFPDNPESKAPSQFTYTRQFDGIALAHKGFSTIHSVVETLAAAAGAPRMPLERRIDFQPAIQLEEGVRRATAVLSTDMEARKGMVFIQTEERHLEIQLLADAAPS